MPNESESSTQPTGPSADIGLVLAHLREQAGVQAEQIAVQKAIIQTQAAEIDQLKSMLDGVAADLPQQSAASSPSGKRGAPSSTRKKK